MAARFVVIGFVVGTLMPLTAAAADATCEKNLEDFQRVTEVVVIGGETEREVQKLWSAAKTDCTEDRAAAARDKLNEAWAAVLGDDRLLVPTVAEVATDTCSEGMQTVEAMLQQAAVGDLTISAAENLITDARQLCQADAKLDAQDKLAMVWTMLEGR